jgi:hypothetical protein
MSEFNLAQITAVIRQNNLYRVTLYNKFRQDNGGSYKGVTLPSAPWRISKKSAREFMDQIFPERTQPLDNPRYTKIQRASLEDHVRLAKSNHLLLSEQFSDFVKKQKDKRFFSNPWVKFHIKVKDFFRMAHPDYAKMYSCHLYKSLSVNPKEHVRICINNELTNSRKWRQFYLTNRANMAILSRPWDRFNMDEKEFFVAVRANNMEAFKDHDTA